MRKIFIFLFAFLVFIPISLNAKEIKLNDDFTISFDENEWYIFTKDNLKDNPELEELGITYDYMDNYFKTNDVEVDAITYFGDEMSDYIEVLIQINEMKSSYDYDYLGYLSKSDLNEVAEEVGKKLNSNNSKVYENGKYTFIQSEYVASSETNLHYYTVVNNKGYNIMFKKMKNFDEDDKKIVKNIMDTISIELPEKKFRVSPVVKYAIIGALVGGIYSGISNLSKKKKLKKIEKETD